VRARDLAPQLLSRQPASAKPITVRMRHGATVTGKLVWQGKPLPGVGVGLVQAERAAQYSSYRREEIATDERGVFTFVNVTPGQDYWVRGAMASLHDFGALDTTRVHVGSDESLAEVGNLVVGPGRHVSGRVVLCDSTPVPPDTRLLLYLEPSFDAQSQTLGPDGRFDLRGVPPGEALLTVRLQGYRIARESSGYSNQHGLPECLVPGDGDVAGLKLVLEPGGDPESVRVTVPAPPAPQKP